MDLDHPSIQIISDGSSSLDHHGCYLMILLIIVSSTEPTLFHAGCRPILHVGLIQRLYLTPSQNGPPSTYIKFEFYLLEESSTALGGLSALHQDFIFSYFDLIFHFQNSKSIFIGSHPTLVDLTIFGKSDPFFMDLDLIL